MSACVECGADVSITVYWCHDCRPDEEDDDDV